MQSPALPPTFLMAGCLSAGLSLVPLSSLNCSQAPRRGSQPQFSPVSSEVASFCLVAATHHLPGQAHQLLSASHPTAYRIITLSLSSTTQTTPYPSKGSNATSPPTSLVVLLLLFYFCHDTRSQAGFISKNAQHPWTSLAPHPQFLKPARGKHPLISATGPGHTVGFCHVSSLASWVSCWNRPPTLRHIPF